MWAILALLFVVSCRDNRPTPAPDRASDNSSIPVRSTPKERKKETRGVPDYALEVLTYVRKHGEAPDGYVGGRTFQNRERRLPQTDAQGQRAKYREWDVFPKQRGKNRGAERLITSEDGGAWYTRDHYKTFKKIE